VACDQIRHSGRFPEEPSQPRCHLLELGSQPAAPVDEHSTPKLPFEPLRNVSPEASHYLLLALPTHPLAPIVADDLLQQHQPQ
jgi:hypothetical protein